MGGRKGLETMTETERITHAVYDRRSDLPPEVENLGLLAAHCELEAWRQGNPDWLKKSLLDQAHDYREAQLSCWTEFHRCHTSGCLNLVAGDDYCARCAEEINGQPCTFAEILSEMPKWAHWLFWTAAVAVVGSALSILLILL